MNQFAREQSLHEQNLLHVQLDLLPFQKLYPRLISFSVNALYNSVANIFNRFLLAFKFEPLQSRRSVLALISVDKLGGPNFSQLLQCSYLCCHLLA